MHELEVCPKHRHRVRQRLTLTLSNVGLFLRLAEDGVLRGGRGRTRTVVVVGFFRTAYLLIPTPRVGGCGTINYGIWMCVNRLSSCRARHSASLGRPPVPHFAVLHDVHARLPHEILLPLARCVELTFMR